MIKEAHITLLLYAAKPAFIKTYGDNQSGLQTISSWNFMVVEVEQPA